MTQERKRLLFITQAALIAGIYVALTLIFAPISYNVMQIRISDMLTILPMFTAAAIPGLFIGCIIANLAGGAIIVDVIFGSLATLIGAIIGYRLRSNRWLVPIPAVLANTFIVPLVLKYGYLIDVPLPVMMVYLFIGEMISCYLLGELLATVLLKHKLDFLK